MKTTVKNGFTLIELMIAVIIIGIIAGVAYPTYLKFITESRRSDATINLSRIAALQERFFTQCSIYAQNFNFATPQSCTAPGTLANTHLTAGVTQDGHYTITIAPGDTGDLASSYIMTAVPNGRQATEDGAKCSSFTISNTGIKTATGTESTVCWKK